VLTMNSVKILHAVRSAITAIAELLVSVLIETVGCSNCMLRHDADRHARGKTEMKIKVE